MFVQAANLAAYFCYGSLCTVLVQEAGSGAYFSCGSLCSVVLQGPIAPCLCIRKSLNIQILYTRSKPAHTMRRVPAYIPMKYRLVAVNIRRPKWCTVFVQNDFAAPCLCRATKRTVFVRGSRMHRACANTQTESPPTRSARARLYKRPSLHHMIQTGHG